MSDLNGITPAFYALAGELSERVLRENRSHLRTLLEAEKELYELAFKLYVLAREAGCDRRSIRNFFCTTLREKSILNIDSEKVRTLGNPVHDEYWLMAERESCWLAGARNSMDGLMPFADLVARWKIERGNSFEETQVPLRRMREVLAA